MAKNSREYTTPLKTLLSKPSVVMVAIDPDKNTFHAVIKTAEGERKWDFALTPAGTIAFQMVKGLLEGLL